MSFMPKTPPMFSEEKSVFLQEKQLGEEFVSGDTDLIPSLDLKLRESKNASQVCSVRS